MPRQDAGTMKVAVNALWCLWSALENMIGKSKCSEKRLQWYHKLTAKQDLSSWWGCLGLLIESMLQALNLLHALWKPWQWDVEGICSCSVRRYKTHDDRRNRIAICSSWTPDCFNLSQIRHKIVSFSSCHNLHTVRKPQFPAVNKIDLPRRVMSDVPEVLQETQCTPYICNNLNHGSRLVFQSVS